MVGTPRPQRGETVRRRYADLIDAFLAQEDPVAADECARLAVGQGVWRDPLQRPVHYLPSLDPVPVHDPADFWFVPYLEENYPLIRAELEQVLGTADNGFLPVEEPLLATGDWKQVTFYEGGQRFDEACERFPVTAGIIEAIPEATLAGPGVVTLSRLQPGSRIVPHCGASNAKLRVHLGLHVPEGPRMRVGDRTLRWNQGSCLVFDDSFEHEVWHTGDAPRVVLLMDVWHPRLDPAVQRLIAEDRGSLATRVRDFMRAQGLVRAEDTGDTILLHPDERVETLIRRHMRQAGTRVVDIRHEHTLQETPKGPGRAD
ncbi:aspartyl/asparaginyl beta-hydroxylase domain-containing protein [Streptomyces sp. CB03238]|uniref:aspartyl/asparaginyl beta-hydroxylase domain-containing protein n=1 Tax=Streptomyces sp. CB03238 TaxID=1907777 RepID=UPI000A0F515A|nr:aspartyl/asparaginyl beta-hydroxylase domain-containing protein [Streptomyces sp. CB03238]ORT56091.1 peptidase [Streptomyces sp. CB03238]